MIDRLDMSFNEIAILDTTNNSISVLVASGSCNIVRDNSVIVTLGQYESYTLPINTGIYTLISTADNTKAFLFRLFIY
ncbi:MAG: hypothetical protein QXS63_01125 [Zestosphaera sp.]